MSMSMIQRKRREATSKSNGNNNEEAPHEEEDPTTAISPPFSKGFSKGKKGATGTTLTSIFRRRWFLLAAGTACLLTAIAAAWYFLSTLGFLRIVTLLPVAVCLYQGLLGSDGSDGNGDGDGSSRLLPLALVATVVMAQLPSFLGAAVAALAVLFFSLVTLPTALPPAAVVPSLSSTSYEQTNVNTTINATTPGNSNGITHDSTNNKHPRDNDHRPLTNTNNKANPKSVVLAVIVLVTVLLTENFMIWVVSATFEPGHKVSTAPPPLQDNGRNMIQFILKDLTKAQVVGLRRLWNVQWSLVACLGVSLFIVQVYKIKYAGHSGRDRGRHAVHRQLYSIGTRAVTTLATARCIRTVSFLLTVLPSQNKACYQQHFPFPPPVMWYDWLAVGLEPASHGGCNDLIISGHATVTATMACVASSVSMSSSNKNNRTFAAALWIMVVLDYCIEIYEGFHYAVDMWLGMVLVSLLWHALAPLEERDYYHENDDGDKGMITATRTSTDSSNKPSVGFHGTMKDAGLYSLPALAAYLQLAVMPQSTANPLIVVYLLFASMVYGLSTNKSTSVAVAQAYQHYAQHVLLCLLFLALGVYL
jgi:hypothetical protein